MSRSLCRSHSTTLASGDDFVGSLALAGYRITFTLKRKPGPRS